MRRNRAVYDEKEDAEVAPKRVLAHYFYDKVALYSQQQEKKLNPEHTTTPHRIFVRPKFKFLKILIVPLLSIMAILSCYYSYDYYARLLFDVSATISTFTYLITLSAIMLCCYWLLVRLLNCSKHYLLAATFFSHYNVTRIVLPFVISVVKIIAFLTLINIAIPYLGIPEKFEFFATKVTSICIILSIAWLLFQLVDAGEQLLLNYYAIKTASDITARKIYTQMLILKRIILTLILILTLGAILTVFDHVRALGASVLTTAGIVGLLLTFTAQRSLPSIFAGLEIALAQPIKIGDNVIVENESGTVEEINFRNVIIKLWDWRRLVVPTAYFLEKPFQNLSREQPAHLIGTVYMYVDFTLPLSILRTELTKILATSKLWDGKVNTIQVSDLKEQAMQLRILVSAATPTHVSDLRCEIREKLITFIGLNYPAHLPGGRIRSMAEL